MQQKIQFNIINGGGINLAVGDLYVQSNWTEAADELGEFKVYRRANSGATTIVSSAVAAQAPAQLHSFDIAETTVGTNTLTAKTISVTTTGAATDAELIADGINSAAFTNIVASVDSSNRVVISHTKGGDFRITDTDGLLGLIGFSASTDNLVASPGTVYDFMASN